MKKYGKFGLEVEDHRIVDFSSSKYISGDDIIHHVTGDS